MAGKQNSKAAAKEILPDQDLSLGHMSLNDLQALGLEEQDVMKGLDAVFVPNQEGFEKGVVLFGRYVGTKRCVSTKEKKPNWKPLASNPKKVYRDMIIMDAVDKAGTPTKKQYGIFSVGTLGFVMNRIKPGQLVGVEYTGVADRAFKEGQSKPHTFRFYGKDLDLNPTDLGALEPGVEEVGDVA